jgi:alpha-beta hydrolase superfamily lysophospholipase
MRSLIFLILTILSINTFAIKPEKEYKTTPDQYGIHYQEQKITTPDRAELNTWIFQPDTLKRDITIIITGPDAGNMSYSITQVYYLLKKGYRIITFDYRGFGHSSDFEINPNQLYYDEFATDLQTIISFTRNNYHNTKIGVWGLSMGSLISLLATDYDFLIAEGTFNNPQAVVERIFKIKARKIVLPKSSNTITNLTNSFNKPALLFAGTQDKTTPIEDSQKLIKNNVYSNLIIFNGEHLQGVAVLQQKYFDYIASFVNNLK